ncbi:MAG: hypothetical protein CSB44_05110 [Gammaproteobacteria bacterium]|nr:MAG: hypothetical protein CSB44_05110 [Gammaproteobacteria bacterium]PIE36781.1 MAG: hypothetical protein CSA54_03275 [Gammaproteobacteria bacterium]
MRTQADQLISRDFAHVIAQVPELAPESSAIRAGNDEAFGRTLLEELAARGYRVLDSNSGEAAYTLETYRTEAAGANNNELAVYVVAVGPVSLRRRYSFDEFGQIKPAGSMFAKGVRATAIEVDDSIWEKPVQVAGEAPGAQQGAEAEATMAQAQAAAGEASGAGAQLGTQAAATTVQATRAEAPKVNGDDLAVAPAAATTEGVTATADIGGAAGEVVTVDADTASGESEVDKATASGNGTEAANAANSIASTKGSPASATRDTAARGSKATMAAEAKAENPAASTGADDDNALAAAGGDGDASDKPMTDVVAPLTSSLGNAGDADSQFNNLAGKDQSIFAETFVSYDNVEEQIIVFPNDSAQLGSANRYLVNNFAKRFVDATDLIHVVGCSNGITGEGVENETLAIDRGERVKEALMYAGVPEDRIMSEGCWSGEAGSQPYPSRGVVMTLKRTGSS